MSKSEVERFVSEARTHQRLSQSIGDVFEGKLGLEELVRQARKAGYDIAVEEVKEHVATERRSIETTAVARRSPNEDIVVTNASTNITAIALIVPFVTGSVRSRKAAD